MNQPENIEELRAALLDLFAEDGEYVIVRTADAALFRAAVEELIAGLTLSEPTPCQKLVGAWLIAKLEKNLQNS